jgi:hypothetical protein
MSSNSNLGYSNIKPYENINGNFVNKYSSNNPAFFGTNQIPGLPGLSGAKNNIDAANSKVPGVCLFKGGAKKFKKKIKNITKKYKMPKINNKDSESIKRKIKTLRKKLPSKISSISHNLRISGGAKHKSRKYRNKQRGGYSQYYNNLPVSNTYSLGGHLSAKDLGLANPVPILKVANSAIDNYSRYLNVGFPSIGH